MARSSLSGAAAAVALLLGAGLFASDAAGQSVAPPPEHYTQDARGVDLVSGQFTFATAEIAIGSGVGGLVHARARVGKFWYDLGLGWAACDTSGCTVVVQGQSEAFTGFVTSYTPVENTGSTLSYDTNTGFYDYRLANGAAYRFDSAITNLSSQPGAAALVKRTDPNGLVFEYSYLTQQVCAFWDEWGNCVGYMPVSRVQSYGNNAGYRLHYEYAGDDAEIDQGAFITVDKVTGYNGTVDYCAPLATSCTFSRTWPSVTYSWDSGAEVVTDELGRQARYYVYADGPNVYLTAIRNKGSTVDDVTIGYLAPDLVGTVTDATGEWEYDYSVSGSTLTTTVTGPLDQELTVESDLTIGRAVKFTDALNNEWTYAYTDGRLVQAMAPEGNFTTYLYDTRGNLTRVRYYDKAGTDFIENSATYASSCVGNVACNSPETTTDAMGRVTNYDWDDTHGGLLSVTEPAPATSAARPQTRYSYAAQTAYFKNASGTIVAASSSITLPTQVSACATEDPTTGCTGTADEVRTAVTYGSTGVANNLLPTQVASGSGTSPNMAVTAMTWTPNGDVETIDGPLSGTGDTSQYRYDDGRQLVGVVGPDPDSTGPRLNRAQRLTYNSRGQVTLAEQGTTPGYTNTDWSSFAVLQKASQGYDSWGRPIRSEMQAANGTVHGLAQVSYDAAGRPECQVVRMNPAVFGSVGTNACALGTQAGYGPDRIVRTTYDVLSRPLSTTSAYGVTGEAITESITYTDNGLPETLTDGAGNVSIIEYDGWDRASKLRYPNATPPGTSTTDFDEWTYDDAGNVLTESRRGVSLTYDWDELNRLIQVVAPSVATRSYEYDNLGRMTEAASAGSLVQTFVWDALGRQTRETSSGGGSVISTYDAAGRRTRLTWPDYWYVDYDFDVYGGLLKVRQQGATSGAGVLAIYAYDDLGRRTGSTLGNGATATYGWDAVSRLSSIGFNPAGTSDDLTIAYAYDPAGGIVQRTLSDADYAFAPASGSTSYTNDGLNRVTSVASSSVTYDGAENATVVPGGPTLAFDGLNQATSSTLSSVTTPLGYDSLGRLRQTGASTTKVSYVYDGVQLIQEIDNTGAIIARHVPGAGLDAVVASVDGAGARIWLMADERGSVMALMNSASAVTQVNAWDEYGVPRSGNSGRFQYTGQVWLPFAELQNSRARIYDPSVGRFRQTDPMGYAAGANVYSYVGADPVNWLDPMGMDRDPSGGICVMPSGNADIDRDGLGPFPPCPRGPPGVRRGFSLNVSWHDINIFRPGNPDTGSIYDGAFGGCVTAGDCGTAGGVFDLPEHQTWRREYERVSAENAIYAEPVLLVTPAGWFGKARWGGSIIRRICNCFVEGTLVHTADGLKPVQEVAVGDLVLSRDEVTGQTDYKPVSALIAGAERQIWEVAVETVDIAGTRRTETFGTTDEHPWRLVGGEWRETRKLAPGDQLVTADGRMASVLHVTHTGRVESTYNFEVEGFHTYFVGEVGAWVHNICPPRWTKHGLNSAIGYVWGGGIRRGVTPWAYRDALRSPTRIAHVVDERGRASVVYHGRSASVAVNPTTGQIITMWPRGGSGLR
jgi:RHS repeat-associated protein